MERLLGASHERKCSVFAVMKNPAVTTTFQARTRESIEAFVEFIERTRAQLARPSSPVRGEPHGACNTLGRPFLDEIGYFAELRRWKRTRERPRTASATSRNSSPRWTAPATPRSRRSTGCKPFWSRSRWIPSARTRRKSTGDAVTLITMHSCKGLEFPHVFIVGLEDGLLPHSRSKAEGTLDEERRLFYVAVTRAMQTLTISHCGGRKKYGQ